MYKVVKNNQLELVEERYKELHKDYYSSIDSQNPIYFLGRFSTTNSFSIEPNGTISVTYANEDTNDTFAVDIQMVKISCNVHFSKQAPHFFQNKDLSCHRRLAFSITIGDIFKHYFKTCMQATAVKQNRKKDDKEIKNNSNEDMVKDFVQKSLKVSTSNRDVKVLLGAIGSWNKHQFRLWDALLDQGHLQAFDHDFESFCNTFVLLPWYKYDPLENVFDCLSRLSSYNLVYKLLQFFAFGEDPSEHLWMVPEIEYFDPKPIAIVLEEHYNELTELYSDYDSVKLALVRELNNKNKADLEDKYPPQIFDSVRSVGQSFPLHALRTILITSWCTSDFDFLKKIVRVAESVAKSGRAKNMIKKRGHFQYYNAYGF